jgi:hypothetical protein
VTAGAVLRRHDRVVKLLVKNLERKDYTVTEEPHIQTMFGMRKPDIIAVKNWCVHVIDPTICGDYRNPDYYHREKVRKYAQDPDIVKYLRDKYPGHLIKFTSLTVSFRGVFSKESAEDLLNLGVSKATLKKAALHAIEGSVMCFRWFFLNASRMNFQPRRGTYGRV